MKYFRLEGIWSPCQLLSCLWSSCRQYINEWSWLCFNKTLFPETGSQPMSHGLLMGDRKRHYQKQKKENCSNVQWHINIFSYFCSIRIYFIIKENKDVWNKTILLPQLIANLTKIRLTMCLWHFRRAEEAELIKEIANECTNRRIYQYNCLWLHFAHGFHSHLQT